MTKKTTARLQPGDVVNTPRGPRTIESAARHDGQGYYVMFTDGTQLTTMAGRKWEIVQAG
jgi:hypothetical protein